MLHLRILLFLLIPGLVFGQIPGYKFGIADSSSTEGYYFMSLFQMRKKATKTLSTQVIFNGKGELIYFRGGYAVSDFKVQPDGRMSYFCGDKFYLTDGNFNITDSVSCVNGIETDPHDFQVLPDGHYLLLGMESETCDLSAKKVFLQKDAPGSRNAKVKYHVVQELDQKKKLVYEWRAKPFFSFDDISLVYLQDTAQVDVTHFNSVELMPDGNFLISARYTNELIKVNKRSGTISWRMGGKHNQFQFINDSLPFLGQHDARILPNGHLTLFDNGYAGDHARHNARALEYIIDEKAMTATLAWSYTYPLRLVSEAAGNMQRLSNGNTMIGYGKVQFMTPNLTCTMVDPAGKTLSLLTCTDTLGSYRAFFYPTLPFRLQQPSIRLVKKKDGISLETVKAWPGYYWAGSEHTRSISIRQPGTYYAYVSVGQGGFLRSNAITVTQEMLRKTSKNR